MTINIKLDQHNSVTTQDHMIPSSISESNTNHQQLLKLVKNNQQRIHKHQIGFHSKNRYSTKPNNHNNKTLPKKSSQNELTPYCQPRLVAHQHVGRVLAKESPSS